MSTLAEIEKAIEELPSPQVDELVTWLLRRRADAGRGTVAKRSVRDFIGRFSTGDAAGADNGRIDGDLSSEAGH